ncbi:MAG: hypothetical protein FD174_1525 [Geobacteraceae bacterium]|nr:MAG: hypothetical protein FD174_1525 [Geobacteraceae bacterium]
MVRHLIAVFMVVFVFAATARGETYEWLDDQGVVHFTDAPAKIPDKYRKRVKVRESVKGEEIRVPPAQEKQPSEPAGSAPMEQQLYGGHDMSWWRMSYESLRDEIKSIQDGLLEKRDRLAALRHRRIVYQKGSDRAPYNELKAEIERDEARMTELQEKIATLDAEASRAGVPSGWRQ